LLLYLFRKLLYLSNEILLKVFAVVFV
jgi:hypothetical protein